MQAAVATGILADTEGLLATVVLSTWQHDIRTAWHALQIERASRSGHGRAVGGSAEEVDG